VNIIAARLTSSAAHGSTHVRGTSRSRGRGLSSWGNSLSRGTRSGKRWISHSKQLVVAANVLYAVVANSSASRVGTVLLESAKNTSGTAGRARVDRGIETSVAKGSIIAALETSRAGLTSASRAGRSSSRGRCWGLGSGSRGCTGTARGWERWVTHSEKLVVAADILDIVVANSPASRVSTVLLESAQNISGRARRAGVDGRIEARWSHGGIIAALVPGQASLSSAERAGRGGSRGTSRSRGRGLSRWGRGRG